MAFALLGIGGALAIGVALGLLGSGGSVITVPVLVYLFGQTEKLAIAGSLGVVGIIALSGALLHARAGTIVPRVALIFAPAGMAGSWLGALASSHVSGTVQLRVFAVAMLVAAAPMIFPSLLPTADATTARHGESHRTPVLVTAGLAVGLLTGFVGVGGGFLIVPALVMVIGLEMHRAVGTSLAVITLTAFAGFATHWHMLAAANEALDYRTLASVAAIGIAGSILGQRFGGRLPAALLRRVFGVMLVALALFMLAHGAPR